jgi:hypothetical protein
MTNFSIDTIVNKESTTYAEREIIVPEADVRYHHPSLMIEQRTCSVDGRAEMLVHQLFFGRNIDTNKTYVFNKCGDEIPGVGRPNLHCKFRVVSLQRSGPMSWSPC